MNRTIPSPENVDSKNASSDPSNNECSSQTDLKLTITHAPNSHKDANSTDNPTDERKSAANHNLEVIVESDALSEATKSERGSMQGGSEIDDSESKPCDFKSSDGILKHDDGSKHHHNCRRAYSYPATNYIVTGFGSAYSNLSANDSGAVQTTRSRSFSTNCSYISEISLKPCATRNKNENLKTFDTSSLKGSLVFSGTAPDNLCPSNNCSCSLISIADRSSSVVLTLNKPFEVLNFESTIVIKNQSLGQYKHGSDDAAEKRNNQNEILNNVTGAVQRNRKLATFESPDPSLLLKHNPNI